MGFLSRSIQERFEAQKPSGLKADILMISGCEDAQTSADVSNVADFQLPDPAGRAGGACTSALLDVLYKDHQNSATDMSFVQVLEEMRQVLKGKGFDQIPQLSSSLEIDVNETFDLVPKEATGTRRALLIGINYTNHEQGQLSGCHNDVQNMLEYIKDVHEFDESNITVLLDAEGYTYPTGENMIQAYRDLVASAEPGDALFCHYSGHGGKIRDDDRGEEDDGYDETLVPLDYDTNGQIRDDDLYDILIKPLPEGVHLVCIMDCCHSGTVLDLPYLYKADGNFSSVKIDETYNFKKLMAKFGHNFTNFTDE